MEMRLFTRRNAIWIGLTSLAVAGCGSAATSPSTGGSSSGSTGQAASSPSATVVKTATVTVGGTSELVLTDATGQPLYFLSSDTATTPACTGACLGVWPPLLAPSGQPTASGSLPDQLTAVSDANGRQVQYDGHFLYTYSGDSTAGQARGDGIHGAGGIWHVATPSMSTAGSSSPASGGGYSYGG